MGKKLTAEVEAVIQTFEDLFAVSARPFGNPTKGASDGKDGVQWNAYFEEGGAFLGVNLEGMKYQGWPAKGRAWPVFTLIQRELESPTLVDFGASLVGRDEIELSWRRDAWQIQSRAAIEEGNIKPTPIVLSALTAEAWQNALKEARDCFAEDGGRAVQTVTRTSGVVEEMEVSPHLHFRVQIWNGYPMVPLRSGYMKRGRDVLSPLHKWVTDRCA